MVKDYEKIAIEELKEKEYLIKSTFKVFEEDLQNYIENIYSNFHKFNLIQFYYDDINNVNNFHFDDCFIDRVLNEKDRILKKFINNYQNIDFEIVSKANIYSHLNTNYKKIVKKADLDFQAFFNLELKDLFIRDFIKNREELTIKQNLVVEGTNLRKLVYFENSLFLEDKELKITDFNYYIEPFKETINNNKHNITSNKNIIANNIENKETLKQTKQKADKKKNNGILIISIIIATFITLFNTLIIPILGVITGIIAAFIIVLCTTKQPKTFK